MNQRELIALLAVIFILPIAGCRPPEAMNHQKTHVALQEQLVPSGLGVNIHFFEGSEKDYTLISESGTDIVRMDVLWQGIEKTPGVYDFSQQDRLVNDLKKHNLRLLFILAYGNPLYDNGLAPHTPDGRAASARFCKALVSHFAGNGIIWELWNEPNADSFWTPKSNVPDYIEWCRAVVPAIRKADPGACIIAPATSDFDIPFVEACFEKGLLELVDGVSVHPYRNAKRGPESTFDEYENLKVLIDFYKPADKIIPIISGEWGYSSSFVSAEMQGKYLARQWLSNIASNIPVSIWYDWHDDGRDPANAEHNFGTVTFDYKPKPAYNAIKILINQLRGTRFVERLATASENDYVLLFSDGCRFKLALWTTGPAHDFISGNGIKTDSLLSPGGNSVGLYRDSVIRISDLPVYCDVPEPVPAYFRLLETANKLSQNEMSELAMFLSGKSKSGSNFAISLKTLLKNGTQAEKMAAWQILTGVAKSTENTPKDAMDLYYRILGGDAPDRAKKQALYRLAVIGSEESAEKVDPYLTNPEFSKAASVYYMQLAYIYAGEKKFQQALDALFKGTKSTGLRYGADRALRKMEEMGWQETLNSHEMARQNGFIADWNLAGPFPNIETPGIKKVWFPENGYNAAQSQQFGDYTAKWVTVSVDNLWGIVPLAKMFGKNKLAMYAYKEIEMDSDRAAIFKAGTNDGVVCWVNGTKVHENIIDRSLTVDEDVFSVQLKKGRNKLLLKILNSGGNWEFCLRICDTNGVPMKNIQY